MFIPSNCGCGSSASNACGYQGGGSCTCSSCGSNAGGNAGWVGGNNGTGSGTGWGGGSTWTGGGTGVGGWGCFPSWYNPCSPCPCGIGLPPGTTCGSGGDSSCDQGTCPHNPLFDCTAIFGGMYSAEAFTYTFTTATRRFLLNLDSPLPLHHVGFGSSALTIQCGGTYILTFFGNFNFAASSTTRLVFYIKANGKTIPESTVILDSDSTRYQSFERTVIVKFCANTTIQAFLDTDGAGTLSVPDNGFHVQVQRVGA
ncbi:MAG: hypothetical protein LBR73_09040 [Oscillospiraceae bacterium]|jgi:hypothetical protein|nr:hypothetical protein [Oscillospiraceae bacterium]